VLTIGNGKERPLRRSYHPEIRFTENNRHVKMRRRCDGRRAARLYQDTVIEAPTATASRFLAGQLASHRSAPELAMGWFSARRIPRKSGTQNSFRLAITALMSSTRIGNLPIIPTRDSYLPFSVWRLLRDTPFE